MTTDRPYRGAMSVSEAVVELRANAGTQFDPRVVAAVIDVVGGWGGDDAKPADEPETEPKLVAVG